MEFSLHQQIKTGIFVLIGIVVISLSIIFLGEDRMSLTGTYRLFVELKQAQGLSRGSQVTLSGLRVGRVDVIDFSKSSTQLIAVLEIDQKYQQRITEGATVAVKTLGALGDKYIYINPGPADAPAVKSESTLPSDGGEDFLDLMAKKGNDLSNVVDVVNELEILLKNLNQNGRSAQMMENMITTSSQLKALVAETRESLNKDKMREAVTRMASIMAKIDKGDGTLGALINDPSLHQRLSSLLGDSPRRQFLKPMIRETIIHQEKGAKGAK